jgi:hypothetical protein
VSNPSLCVVLRQELPGKRGIAATFPTQAGYNLRGP